mgnify:CR=1 FL=1
MEFVLNMIRGFFMALADSVPGVSGGTIAFMLADWGCEVVDCGTAMLSMHAPYDLLSKTDAYETYRAYKAFFESK